jgi:hypothetical protein
MTERVPVERVQVERVQVRVRGGSPREAQELAGELRSGLRPAIEAELLRPAATRPESARVTAVARAVADGIREARP